MIMKGKGLDIIQIVIGQTKVYYNNEVWIVRGYSSDKCFLYLERKTKDGTLISTVAPVDRISNIMTLEQKLDMLREEARNASCLDVETIYNIKCKDMRTCADCKWEVTKKLIIEEMETLYE